MMMDAGLLPLLQTTTFNLASTVVESYSRLAPSSLSGSVITAGPYKDVPAK